MHDTAFNIDKAIGGILEGLAPFAWPAVVFGVVWLFRKQIQQTVNSLRRQLDMGAKLKYKDVFELQGISVADIQQKDLSNFGSVEKATLEDRDARSAIYERSRGIMLVHAVKRTTEQDEDGLTFFELSIYLTAHQGFDGDGNVIPHGRLNEIDQVAYYLGDKWVKHKYGEWFKVRNGAERFAIKFNKVVGPALCIARVKFHDGMQIDLHRYIDMESVGGVRGIDQVF